MISLSRTPSIKTCVLLVWSHFILSLESKLLWQVSNLTTSCSGDDCCRNQKEVLVGHNSIAFNGSMVHMLKEMRDKRYTLVGDSVMINTYEALVRGIASEKVPFTVTEECVTYDFENGTHSMYDGPSRCLSLISAGFCKPYNSSCSYRNLIRTVVVPSYNVTVSSIMCAAWLIRKSNRTTISNQLSPRMITSSLFEALLQLSDTMVVNVGLHYNIEHHCELFESIVEYIADALQRDMTRNHRKDHYFRGTFPVHFSSIDGTYEAYKKTRHPASFSLCNEDREVESHPTEQLAFKVISHRIPMVSVTDILKSRGAYHKNHETDCVHYCYYYELWYPILSKTFLKYYYAPAADGVAGVGHRYHDKYQLVASDLNCSRFTG